MCFKSHWQPGYQKCSQFFCKKIIFALFSSIIKRFFLLLFCNFFYFLPCFFLRIFPFSLWYFCLLQYFVKLSKWNIFVLDYFWYNIINARLILLGRKAWLNCFSCFISNKWLDLWEAAVTRSSSIVVTEKVIPTV